MGTSIKTLTRLLQFYRDGLLHKGASIADIGTQNLFCSAEQVVSFGNELGETLSLTEASALANGGLLGDLLERVGFRYTAFDIFEGKNTIPLDLNTQTIAAAELARFDLVCNYGTTEHVINQMLAMRTIHDLAKPGGLIHHDLPMAGYLSHCYFRYNLGFFHDLAGANFYDLVSQTISAGATRATPSRLLEIGYPDATFRDYGIEIVFRKTKGAPFSIPVDNSSSAAISDVAWRGDAAITIAPTLPVDLSFLFSRLPFMSITRAYWSRVFDVIRSRL